MVGILLELCIPLAQKVLQCLCKVLLNQEDEFFEVVNAKLYLLKLKHKKVITENLKPNGVQRCLQIT